MIAVETALTISLELEHGGECADFAQPLLTQLRDGHYDLCSVMPLPASLEEWRAEHRTARKRADSCSRLGYRFVRVERDQRADEILAINTSAPTRQGRPMSDGYFVRPSEAPDPEWECERHGVHPYGVEAPEGTLIAYLWAYRSGDLILVSQILGHSAHLQAGVMFCLWQGFLMCEPDDGIVVYNRADSGGQGLQWFKERLGLRPVAVKWAV